MKRLALICVVFVSTNMIVIILQEREVNKNMNEKMEEVVQELRKKFRGSIEFYDVPYKEQYKIEYCLNGLYIVKYLHYDFIDEKNIKDIVLSLSISIATQIHYHYYK